MSDADEPTRTFQDDVAIIECEDPLKSPGAADRLVAASRQLIEEGRKKIVFDFGNVEYIDSIYISALHMILLKARKGEANPIIINLNEKVAKIFKVLHFDTLFPVTATLDDALKYFERPV